MTTAPKPATSLRDRLFPRRPLDAQEMFGARAMRRIDRALPPVEAAYATIRSTIMRSKLLSVMDLLLPPDGRILCQALSSTHFAPAATARATLSTDLRMALLLSGVLSGCLAAACLLDGFANGSLKQRISLSRTAQELAVFMLSDAYLALRRQIVS